jgi:HEAT repeat protein
LKSDAKALEKLAQDKEASVRFALASALAKSDDGLELLKSLAKDANPSVRAAIATAKPAPGRESVLIELTGDPDASVRRTACESLALFKSEASEKALLAGLQDKDQFVRAAAEKSFGALKPEGGSLALAENLLSSGKAFERASAISALGLAGAKGSARGILEVLKSGPDADTAKRCVDALKLLDFKEAASAIAANANSKNDAVKISVAEALGALKGADGFDALIMLAKDKNPEVGRAALRSMGRIADMKFASSICALAADVKTEPARRAAACWAASKLPKLDAKCVAALNRLAVEPCIPEPMTNMKLYDSDDVRISALIALSEAAKRGDEKAKTAYASAMESFKGPFAKMPGKDGGQLLTNLLEDYVRQLELLRFGQTPAPQEIPSQEPELAVRKLK